MSNCCVAKPSVITRDHGETFTTRGWVDSVLANFIAETAIHGAVAVLGSAQSFSSDASLIMFSMPPPWLFGVLFEVFLSPWYSLIFSVHWYPFLLLVYFFMDFFPQRRSQAPIQRGPQMWEKPGGFDLPHEKIWDQPWDLNTMRLHQDPHDIHDHFPCWETHLPCVGYWFHVESSGYPLVNIQKNDGKIHPFYSWVNPRTQWPWLQ